MCFTGHGAGKEKDLNPNDFLDSYYLQVLHPETVVFLGGAKLLPRVEPVKPAPIKDGP
jgi:hypothetical protein